MVFFDTELPVQHALEGMRRIYEINVLESRRCHGCFDCVAELTEIAAKEQEQHHFREEQEILKASDQESSFQPE